MRRTLILLACIIWFSPAHADIDYPQFQRLTTSLLKVEAFNGDGSVSLGTGVVVARGAVATNCHVTQYARSIELVKGALRMPVEAQHANIEHDLCVLYSSSAGDMQVAPLRDRALRVGERVTAVGFIFGVAPRLNPGEVKALYDYDGARVIRSTTPFTSSASGGGLFDDQGRLVGLVTFRSRGGVANHFSIPVKWVSDALAGGARETITPIPGATFWQRSRESQPLFLQVATMDAEGNWFGLADLAERWARAEPGIASPWMALGQAHYRLKQNDAAIRAYRKALAIEPDLAEAWFYLGLAHAGNGNAGETRRAHRVLLGLNARLAAELSRHTIECAAAATTNC